VPGSRGAGVARSLSDMSCDWRRHSTYLFTFEKIFIFNKFIMKVFKADGVVTSTNGCSNFFECWTKTIENMNYQVNITGRLTND
jgi:hypothetical protein